MLLCLHWDYCCQQATQRVASGSAGPQPEAQQALIPLLSSQHDQLLPACVGQVWQTSQGNKPAVHFAYSAGRTALDSLLHTGRTHHNWGTW